MRIAVGGFLHESHSFAPRPTTYADFLHPGGFPPFTARRRADRRRCAATSVPSAGAIAVAEAAGVTLVPLTWCFANPAGPVQDEAFERIAALLCAALSAALDEGPLDGVYLDLHGAGGRGQLPGCRGRAAAPGPRDRRATCRITISLDPHANLTRLMVDAGRMRWCRIRTYPHVDMREAGAQAMRLLLARIARGTAVGERFPPARFLDPDQQPVHADGADVRRDGRRARAIAEQTGAAELAWCFGFPYADFPDCGPAFAAYADDPGRGRPRRRAVPRRAQPRARPSSASTSATADAPWPRRCATPAPGGPVVIADTQDNPGGGGHGDTTGLLAELIRQGAKGAVLCLINDAESAAHAMRPGRGRRSRSVAGRQVGRRAVRRCEARVVRLTDGKFTLTGPMGARQSGQSRADAR